MKGAVLMVSTSGGVATNKGDYVKRLLTIGLAVAAVLGAVMTAGGQAITVPALTTNASVSISTGNTFQTIITPPAAPAQWRSVTIENNNTNTDNCWITVDGGAASKAKAILLLPGGSYTRYFPYVPANAIQGTCQTSADTLYVDYQ
jgi:hypothetical protein